MKVQKITHGKASSLLLVLMVIAGVTTVIFAAERVSLVQYSQSNRDVDNIQALYAAKAGIEDGMARYRFSRNVETLQADTQKDAERYDITTGKRFPSIKMDSLADAIENVASYNPNDQYYDLKITYRGSQVGNFDNKDQSLALAKDDSLKFTGFPNVATTVHGDSDYYLRYKVFFPTAAPANCLVQFQQTDEDTDHQASFEQVQVMPTNDTNGDHAVDSQTETANLLIHTITGTPKLTNTLTVRAYGCDVNIAMQTVEQSGLPAGVDFDTLTTTIESTGYFGQAKRTLIGTIDRRTDRLLSVYEYTLYAGQGSIKPR